MSPWTRQEGPPVVLVDRAGKRWFRRAMQALPGPPAAVCRSDDAWQLAADVRAALDDGIRYFVCVGGDGGFLAVAAGTAGLPVDVLVGYGGGCAALPRSYGLPHAPERAAAHLDGTGSAGLDTIRVEPRSGTAVEVANAIWWGSGRLAGFVAGPANRWRIGFRAAGLRSVRDPVTIGTGEIERELELSGLLIANGKYAGALEIAPRAHPGDGRLELLAFTGPGRDLWAMLPRMPSGTHLPHPRVTELRPRVVDLVGPGRLWADGVDVGRLPARISVVPDRLRVAL